MILLYPATGYQKKQISCIYKTDPPRYPKKYVELPPGSIKAEDGLLLQLELMRDGMTGHPDEWYPSAVGKGSDGNPG